MLANIDQIHNLRLIVLIQVATEFDQCVPGIWG